MARAKKFYLDKAHAKFWGVCAGIADYFGIDPLWVRIGAVLLTVMVTGLTIPIYIVVALVADKKPLSLYDDAEEERLLDRMHRRRARNMRSDLADIETAYTSKSARLAAEIDSLR